jgi:hypothetical protein
VKVKAGRVGPPPLKDGVYYVNPCQDDQMVMKANHFFYYGGTKCKSGICYDAWLENM